EFSSYEGSVAEYQSNHLAITVALGQLVSVMDERYEKMKAAGVRNVSDMPNMPYIVAIIDEYADLVLKTETGVTVQLLAQKGRACGIHLIIATQRASTK